MLTTLATTLGLLLAASPDEPFADLTLAEARSRAESEAKLVLVDFTATWCQPCKRMEKTTWGDETVRAWLAEHAVSIQVDVDREQALAREFEVTSMPTVVALRGGEEFDRIVGYKDAEAFLAWGRDVRAGRRSIDALLERSRALLESTDVRARMEVARELLRVHEYAQALEHYLWVWPASRDEPGMGGVRLSFLLRELATLVEAHEPAREAFLDVVAELQARIDAADVPTFLDWQEWSSLCEAFGERERIVTWYEARRDAEGRLYVDREAEFLTRFIRERVFAVLLQAQRYADAARVLGDPLAYAAEVVRDHDRMAELGMDDVDEALRETLERSRRAQLQSDLAEVYGALLAAERPEQAAAVAAVLLGELDDAQSRLALVRAGTSMTKRPDEAFARWLDEAEAVGANVRVLRRRVERLAEDKAK